MILNACTKNDKMVDENVCKNCTDKDCRHAGEPTTKERLVMPPLREVYALIGAEVINGVPVSFIEFSEFWNTHKSDDGFVLVYLDQNNKVV